MSRHFIFPLLLRALCASTSLVLCNVGNAYAGEIGKVWYDAGERLPYTSEHAVQQAIARRFGGSDLEWEVVSQRVEDGITTYKYVPVPVPPFMSEWNYGHGNGSEQEMVEYLRAQWPSTPGCVTPEVSYAWPDLPGQPHHGGAWTLAETRNFRGTSCKAFVHVDMIQRRRDVTCPDKMAYSTEIRSCKLHFNEDGLADYRYFTEALTGGCEVGNPCNPATGDKHQVETDLALPWIRIERHYHSASSTTKSGLGAGWTHQHNVVLTTEAFRPVTLIDGTGAHRQIVPRKRQYVVADDFNILAKSTAGGYQVLLEDETLYFNKEDSGRLTQRDKTDGTTLHYRYNTRGQLDVIADATGRTLQFHYGAGREDHLIVRVDAGGEPQVHYRYAQGRLQAVTYADGTSRRYHYENQTYPITLPALRRRTASAFRGTRMMRRAGSPAASIRPAAKRAMWAWPGCVWLTRQMAAAR